MLWHGKNFRGFLNKAKEVLFNNTGTDLQSTNAEDAIKEVNSKLVKRTTATVSLSGGGAGGNAADLFGIPLDSIVISLYVEKGNLSANRSYALNMYGSAGYVLYVYEAGQPTTATSVTVSVFYIEPYWQ